MSNGILLVTTDQLPGRSISQVHGLVRGTSVRARNIGRDIVAGMKNLIGGEVQEYTKLMAETREQALDRMRAEAKALGANAVVGLRFSSSEIATGTAEVLVYGTAVTID
ncbi:MAG: hypothetical protein ACI8QS_001590 [Planctomycetota bacterium]|jgi:uncharacterized protein YbjQ (UPF0145 family)